MLTNQVWNGSGFIVTSNKIQHHPDHFTFEIIYSEPNSDENLPTVFTADSYMSFFDIEDNQLIKVICADNDFLSECMGEFQSYLQSLCKQNSFFLFNDTVFSYMQRQIIPFQIHEKTLFLRNESVIVKEDLKKGELCIPSFRVVIECQNNEAHLRYICDKIIAYNEFDDDYLFWNNL